MYIYIYKYAYIYMYMDVYVYIHIYIYISIYTHMYIYVIHLHVCAHSYIYHLINLINCRLMRRCSPIGTTRGIYTGCALCAITTSPPASYTRT